jgi:hypothetical protein
MDGMCANDDPEALVKQHKDGAHRSTAQPDAGMEADLILF